MEKSPLVMAASLVDMMKNVTGKMRILNSLHTDVTVHQGTVGINTGIFDDNLRSQILSVGITANSPLSRENRSINYL
jgi:hypothetical protein